MSKAIDRITQCEILITLRNYYNEFQTNYKLLKKNKVDVLE